MDYSTPGIPVLHHLLELTQTLSESVMWSNHLILFSSCLQSFPASGSFLMSWLFVSGGQSTEASDSASVLPMNIQGWFPLGLTGLISLLSKGLSRVFSSTTVQKHQLFTTQPSLWSNSHIHNMTTGKTIALTRRTFHYVSFIHFFIHSSDTNSVPSNRDIVSIRWCPCVVISYIVGKGCLLWPCVLMAKLC